MSINKLKIAIISYLGNPIAEPFKGGMESFTHYIAKALMARGHEVIVFAAKGTDTGINPYIICDSTKSFDEDYEYAKTINIIHSSDFDIVHNNTFHHIPISQGHTLSVPMVTTLHTPPFEFFEQSIKQSCNKNNTFVAVSNYAQQIWSPIIKTEVIHNGIDLQKFFPLNNNEKENYAIWYGRIAPKKGTLHAIKAALKAGIPLKIAGPIFDDEYFENEIKPLLQGCLSKNDIEYLGALPHDILCKIIAKARVSLFIPEIGEAYGLVAAESLACGTAVASLNRGAMPEILNEKSGVLAQPDNIDSLSDALLRAMKLKTADCRKRAEKIADINIMVDKYEKLYYKLVVNNKN